MSTFNGVGTPIRLSPADESSIGYALPISSVMYFPIQNQLCDMVGDGPDSYIMPFRGK